jgi:hypothetical protein
MTGTISDGFENPCLWFRFCFPVLLFYFSCLFFVFVVDLLFFIFFLVPLTRGSDHDSNKYTREAATCLDLSLRSLLARPGYKTLWPSDVCSKWVFLPRFSVVTRWLGPCANLGHFSDQSSRSQDKIRNSPLRPWALPRGSVLYCFAADLKTHTQPWQTRDVERGGFLPLAYRQSGNTTPHLQGRFEFRVTEFVRSHISGLTLSSFKVVARDIVAGDRIALAPSSWGARCVQDMCVSILKLMMYVDCVDRGKRVSNRWRSWTLVSR